MAMWDIKKELGKDSELFKRVERNYNDVHETYGIMEKTMNKTKMNENFEESKMKRKMINEHTNGDSWSELNIKVEPKPRFPNEVEYSLNIDGSAGARFLSGVEVIDAIKTLFKDNENPEKKIGWNESVGGVPKEPVIFRKDRDDGEVIAFFPETLRDGSCNPGHLMSYAHNGQHSEASIYYYFKCKPCSEEEYADLLTELEGIYTDGLRVMRRMH